MTDMKADHFRPDLILTIMRGGAIPSIILSHWLSVRDVLTLEMRRTQNDEVMSEKQIPAISSMPKAFRLKGKNILIVDDIIGSGITLDLLLKRLAQDGFVKVKTSALVRNLNNFEKSNLKDQLKIDYLGQEVRGWVIFPWERQE